MRTGEVALGLGVLVAVCAALLPVIRVVAPGSWLGGALSISFLILAAGHLARRSRLPGIAVVLVEALVWGVFITVVFAHDTTWLGVIPTFDTIEQMRHQVSTAVGQIVQGTAPLSAGTALSFVIVAATGLLTMAIDHVVLTARMPLLAAVGLIAVSLIPAIAVPRGVDVLAFALLAAAILFLLHVETQNRQPAPRAEGGPAARRGVGVPATAFAIGVIAVVVAVVATPLMPEPVARAGTAVGAGQGISATLQLGEDLRRPQETEVLTVRSSAASPPYLRALTMSQFDGAVWEADRPRSLALNNPLALSPINVDDGIRVDEHTTTIEVTNLNSPWLPVPFAAVGVDGLRGTWATAPFNRTVVAREGSSQGQSYQVVAQVPRPTLEQIRAQSARGSDVREETFHLPSDLPPIIAELAAEVTAGAENDYDRLIALQRWFRGESFTYSLDAPVEDGFDGTGADAVAQFLQQREGYCIHFASAFALMARTLEMPARLVVGYLPGAVTSEVVDRQTVHSVSNARLHAWPEVHFAGTGWVAFEPTKSLGVPTAFSAAASPSEGADAPADDTTPSPTATPSAPTDVPLDDEFDVSDGSTPGAIGRTVNPLPAIGTVLAVLCVLALPALVRGARRRRLLAAARSGDAAAAWRSVQDAAIDLGIPVAASESARALGARLVADHGAPAHEMDALVGAIERASYAPAGALAPSSGADAAATVRTVERGLLRTTTRMRRVLALALPRSLVMRPGGARSTPDAADLSSSPAPYAR